MRPVTIKLRDFGSYYGEHALLLESYGLVVVVGENGSGKTTLMVDAPRWALFGVARGNADSVIAQGRESCSVELEFRLRAERYRVVRSRTRKGGGATVLSFAVWDGAGAWRSLDGGSLRETQAVIERVTGLTDHLWTMTACAAQGAAGFVGATAGDRKEVLESILGIAHWAAYEAEARKRLRAVEGAAETIKAQLTTAQEQADQRPDLEVELAGLETRAGELAQEIAAAEAAIEEARLARARLERERDEDAQRRAELTAVGERLTAAEASLDETTKRLNDLTADAAGKADVEAAIAAAEAAAASADTMEQARQEAARIDHELELAAQHRKTAQAERRNQVGALTARRDAVRREHEHNLDRLAETVDRLSRQAEVLGDVPCQQMVALAEKTGVDVVTMTAARECESFCANCPLLTDATAARADLAECEKRLEQLKPAQPWADADAELAGLQKTTPGAEHETIVAELTERRAAVVYDAKPHTEAKRLAGQLPGLQKAFASATAAEAAMVEVVGQRGREADVVARLKTERDALAATLGKPTSWDEQITQAQAVVDSRTKRRDSLRAEADGLGRQRGSLEERIRAATEAAERVTALADERRANADQQWRLDRLVRAFGSNGIPAAIVGDALPELARLANEHLQSIAGGELWVDLRTQREKRAGAGMVETLDIVTYGALGERLLETFSGGEQVRIAVAMRFALSALIAGRAGANLLWAPGDETMAPLDVEGQDAHMESLAAMARDYGMFIPSITHVARWHDFTPRFEISRDSEGSHVEAVAG